MKVSRAVYELLIAIDKISSNNKYKIAKIEDIAKELNKENLDSLRILLTRVKKRGLIDNPVVGGYILTEEGKKTIQKISIYLHPTKK